MLFPPTRLYLAFMQAWQIFSTFPNFPQLFSIFPRFSPTFLGRPLFSTFLIFLNFSSPRPYLAYMQAWQQYHWLVKSLTVQCRNEIFRWHQLVPLPILPCIRSTVNFAAFCYLKPIVVLCFKRMSTSEGTIQVWKKLPSVSVKLSPCVQRLQSYKMCL